MKRSEKQQVIEALTNLNHTGHYVTPIAVRKITKERKEDWDVKVFEGDESGKTIFPTMYYADDYSKIVNEVNEKNGNTWGGINSFISVEWRPEKKGKPFFLIF